MKKGYVDAIGTVLFILGLGGLGSACEGQGSFIVATIVFGIGFGLTLLGYKRRER